MLVDVSGYDLDHIDFSRLILIAFHWQVGQAAIKCKFTDMQLIHFHCPSHILCLYTTLAFACRSDQSGLIRHKYEMKWKMINLCELNQLPTVGDLAWTACYLRAEYNLYWWNQLLKVTQQKPKFQYEYLNVSSVSGWHNTVGQGEALLSSTMGLEANRFRCPKHIRILARTHDLHYLDHEGENNVWAIVASNQDSIRKQLCSVQAPQSVKENRLASLTPCKDWRLSSSYQQLET